jgi:hypothetical protein
MFALWAAAQYACMFTQRPTISMRRATAILMTAASLFGLGLATPTGSLTVDRTPPSAVLHRG